MRWWTRFTKPSPPPAPAPVVVEAPAVVAPPPPPPPPPTPRPTPSPVGRPRKGHTRANGTPAVVLTEDQQVALVRMVAEFWPIPKIQAALAERYGLTVSRTFVSGYAHRPKWQGALQRMRAAYLAEVTAVPLANDRVRLERLEETYQSAMAEPAESGKARAAQRREVVGVLSAAREEMHRVLPGGGTNIIAVQFNQLSDAELEAKKAELLRRLTTSGGLPHARVPGPGPTQEAHDGQPEDAQAEDAQTDDARLSAEQGAQTVSHAERF